MTMCRWVFEWPVGVWKRRRVSARAVVILWVALAAASLQHGCARRAENPSIDAEEEDPTAVASRVAARRISVSWVKRIAVLAMPSGRSSVPGAGPGLGQCSARTGDFQLFPQKPKKINASTPKTGSWDPKAKQQWV